MTNKKTTEKNKQSSILLSIKLFFKRIDNELETNFRKWIRSPTTIFFTLLYPIIFILILGSIFSGIEEPFSFELYVQNKDQGVDLGYTTYNFWNDTIEPIITGINNSDNESLINVLDVPLIDGEGANISAGIYLEQQEGYICVVIPETFTAKVLSKTPVNLTIISVETVQSAGIVSEILLNILYDFNIGFNNETYKVQLETVDFLVGEEITYVEYLLPGMIAITFMNNALMSTITRFNYNRTTGFFKKLSSSPMRRADFVTSEMIW
ncbi:MAG: ABC transporter permease, partial [Asgard group archaeon]|nr:ABC transporter permease [Asgard group archaeon]